MTERSSSEIERDIADTRARMRDDVDAIQERLSPGQLMDQVLGYMHSGGSEFGHGASVFAHNFGRSIRDNPVPVAMIGTALAWMMVGGRRRRQPSAADYDTYAEWEAEREAWDEYDELDEEWLEEEAAAYDLDEAVPMGAGTAAYETGPRYGAAAEGGSGERASDTAYGARERASAAAAAARERASSTTSSAQAQAAGAAGTARERAREGAEAVRERATGAAGAAREGVRGATDSARRGFARASAGTRHGFGQARRGVGRGARRFGSATRYGADRAGSGIVDLWHEQPLVFGALGIAIGAAIAAALPTTRREDEWLGESRDDLKHRAVARGRAEAERVSRVAERAAEAARREAERQGLTPEQASEQARAAGEAARQEARAAGRAAGEEVAAAERAAGDKAVAAERAAGDKVVETAEKLRKVGESVEKAAKQEATRSEPESDEQKRSG